MQARLYDGELRTSMLPAAAFLIFSAGLMCLSAACVSCLVTDIIEFSPGQFDWGEI